MASGTVHSFRPLGTEVGISWLDPEGAAVVDTVAATLGAYPATMALGGAISIEVRVHEETAIDPGWPVVRAVPDADGIVVRCGSSVVDVRHGTSTVMVELARSLVGIPDAVRLLVEAAYTSIQVAHGRLHAVHSALVVRDGVGLLLRGPSGAGKSTLTYASVRRGMTMVSDDWIYAPAARPVTSVAGYPWRLMLTEPAAARFPELAGAPLVPHTSAEGWKVPVVPPPAQRCVEHEVHAVVLLDPSTELSLEHADVADARARFWDAALDDERLRLDTAWVDDLLSRPTFVLRRGTSPDDAAALLDDLAATFPTWRTTS
jgi:hypothetical protein